MPGLPRGAAAGSVLIIHLGEARPMAARSLDLRVLEMTDTGQLVEWLYDDGENDDLLVCAAHGGAVEPGTGEQALELATRIDGATCWARLGFDEVENEFDLWHPPSTALSPADNPLLDVIADRGFETVVSFHGLEDGGLLVGGAIDDATKERVRHRLDESVSAAVRVVSTGQYAGTSERNFVNWLARGTGGLQLEQGPTTRTAERHRVVDTLETLLKQDRV